MFGLSTDLLQSTWLPVVKNTQKKPTILQRLHCVFLEAIAEIQGNFMEHNITQHTDNTS